MYLLRNSAGDIHEQTENYIVTRLLNIVNQPFLLMWLCQLLLSTFPPLNQRSTLIRETLEIPSRGGLHSRQHWVKATTGRLGILVQETLQFLEFPGLDWEGAVLTTLLLNRGFCPNCGSSLYSKLSAAPQIIIIKAGSIDKEFAGLVKPNSQVFTDSAQVWCDHQSGMFASMASKPKA